MNKEKAMEKVKHVIPKLRDVSDSYCIICSSYVVGTGGPDSPYSCRCGQYRFSCDDDHWLHPKEVEARYGK